MSTTPGERRLQARHAAYTRWANTDDRAAAPAAARDGLLARFERQVDPNGELSPQERLARAEMARKAYYADLARKSAAARRKRRRQPAA